MIHRLTKKLFPLLSLAAAVAALAGLSATTALAVPPRYFGATIDPASVSAGATAAAFSLTITNCKNSGICLGYTSNNSMADATVQVPAAFTVDSGTLSVSAPASKIWSASLSSGTISLHGTGTNKLDPGESLTLSFHATASCTAGPYQWTTAAYNDISDTSSSYALVGLQPSVTISGSCSLPPTGFVQGQYCGYTQGGWGAAPHGNNVGQILASYFTAVYTSGVAVGSPFSMTFQAASDVEAYLPAGGTPGQLTGNLANPTSSSAGVFGGQVLALRLNVDLNDAGIIDGTKGSISSLVLTGTGGSLDGKTIAQILTAAETALGGGTVPSGYTVSTLSSLIDLLNQAFDNCVPSDWAQTHLTAGS
jgi:hypothetical protein